MTPINEWGTIAFERSFIRQMLQDDPRRGVENWLRMVPPAYRDDMKLWIERRFNPKWACQKATRETMAAVEEDILGFLRTAVPYRAPIPDDGSPWIADPSPWELRPETSQRPFPVAWWCSSHARHSARVSAWKIGKPNFPVSA